jgi:histidyl-tRNA synthetase
MLLDAIARIAAEGGTQMYIKLNHMKLLGAFFTATGIDETAQKLVTQRLERMGMYVLGRASIFILQLRRAHRIHR